MDCLDREQWLMSVMRKTKPQSPRATTLESFTRSVWDAIDGRETAYKGDPRRKEPV